MDRLDPGIMLSPMVYGQHERKESCDQVSSGRYACQLRFNFAALSPRFHYSFGMDRVVFCALV